MSNLPQITSKIKTFYGESKSDLFVAGLIFLVGLSSFGLGRLSVIWPAKEPIRIEYPTSEIVGTGEGESGVNDQAAAFTAPAILTEGKYVASKSGSAYHFPWCSGAARIKEENKIWFNTAEEAVAAGYRAAKNCPGL